MQSYIGLPPSGYAKPLELAQNLNDVPDKAQALINLGAASIEDVSRAANPIGSIIAFYGNTSPPGYLPCSGQTVSSTIFPALVQFLNPGNSSATLPDMRGEFLRGWDNGRGIDLGRAIKTAQLDALQNITGAYSANNGVQLAADGTPAGAFSGGSASVTIPSGSTGTGIASMTFDASRVARTSTETRPRNISVLYCIKAYDAPVNQGTVDVAVLASEMGLKIPLTSFTGTNQSLTLAGYQKLPGGLIFQWGTIFSSAATVPATFPIVYPNLCFSITMLNPSTTNLASLTTRSNSGFTASFSSTGGGTNYIAVGY